ncbi:hypothetical protein P170DRAFT_505455 [Aspergillus steynii IBT 23096]|uniref:C2H2-type domain-containing protein n=1 Tax=Aspergillus steynii IBT 23096 TaxID=1392250 RepID=A0A2I2GPF4_9EURO|nr:uncharacterized protein P170DRAFT_505455 [Aspergillus steynii IBT 23096]PLB54758.1 hypothetical protein P170DRAFT_505455 [Aspergillus steynii IBT 23096]
MPWSAQICPFCHKRYANKTALKNHLSEYTGRWRLPADGHHDVLQIKKVIRRLYPSFYDKDEDRKYRCWTCSKIIPSRRRFTEHVVYRSHCGFDPESWEGSRSLRKWSLPFDEDTVLLREDPFPFLHLPPELRFIVYRFIFCFEEVSFGKELRRTSVELHRNGLWLQHNPDNNPLAIMSVSHQIYDEARRTYYAENRFSFESFDNLPVFLVGIGVENAMLLRSVSCKDRSGQSQDCTGHIQSCLRQAARTGDVSTRDLHIHPVEDLYLDLANQEALRPSFLPFYWSDNRRLLRPEVTPVNIYPNRMRFILSATIRQNGNDGAKAHRTYIAGFELNVQRKQGGS